MLNLNQVIPYIQDHYGLIILSIISIYIIHYIYHFCQPFDNVFVDYNPNYGPAPEVFIKHRLGALPTIHPYGWSPLLESRDLKKRQVLSVNLYEEDLVVYRDGSGEVHVFDAYCPHLGANIGVGGTVEGSDRLRCPFHGWTFNTDGKCVDVPGLDKASLPKASLKKWPSAEASKFIWIWRHPDEPEPKWPCITMPNVDEDKLTCMGRVEYNVMMAVQDYGENSFDYDHFLILHGDLKPLNNYTIQKGFWIDRFWRPIERMDYDFSHVCFKFPEFDTPLLFANLPRIRFSFMGFEMPADIVTSIVECTNPYSFFYTHVTKAHVTLIANTIIKPMPGGMVKVVLRYYLKDSSFATRILTRYFMPYLTNLVIQQDSPIWQNRLYLSRPHLTKMDHGVIGWRRWLGQFYGNSKKADMLNGSDDQLSTDNCH